MSALDARMREQIEEALADTLYDHGFAALDTDEQHTVRACTDGILDGLRPILADRDEETVAAYRRSMAARLAASVDDPEQLAEEMERQTAAASSEEPKQEAAASSSPPPDLATVWAHGATTALQRVQRGVGEMSRRYAAARPSYQKEGATQVLRELQTAVGQLVVDGQRRRIDRPRRQT